MDLIDRLRELQSRIPKQIDHIHTEEATKNAFVMPFISALGYDVFNPMEVIPEFTADVGIKKGEKVDYAILKEGKIVILVECKWCGADVHQVHASQLYRYFSVTDARFGIVTNGIVYQFFSDLDKPNRMDETPFFEFDMLNFDEYAAAELKKFSKTSFELDAILETASTLKYSNAVKAILEDELREPSDDFVRFFASRVYGGRLTQNVMDQFREIVKDARTQFINDKVNDRLRSALSVGNKGREAAKPEPGEDDGADEVAEVSEKDGIVTTTEELEAFHIVRALLKEVVSPDRVVLRDTKSYCGVLLDDNNRKPICRLHFNTANKYVGLFREKVETKEPIDEVYDIVRHAKALKGAVKEYGGSRDSASGVVSS